MSRKGKSGPRWNSPSLSQNALHQQKKEAMIRAAGRAFRGRAFHDTTMDDIAKTLNVSKGALYYYVPNKQALLYECHKLAMDIGEAAYQRALREGQNGLHAFSLFLQYYIEQITEDLGSSAMLAEVSALAPEQQLEIIQLRDRQEQRYRELIEAGIADGSIRGVDPKIAVFYVIGAINWMTKWYTEEGEYDGKRIAEGFVDLMQHGLLCPTAPPP